MVWSVSEAVMCIYLWAHVTPPGSAPSHRAGLEPGMPAREAGALPRRLKATASSKIRLIFEVRGVRFTHSPYWHTSVTHSQHELWWISLLTVVCSVLHHHQSDSTHQALTSSIQLVMNHFISEWVWCCGRRFVLRRNVEWNSQPCSFKQNIPLPWCMLFYDCFTIATHAGLSRVKVTVAWVTHGLVRTVTVARVSHGLVRTVTVARVSHGLVRTVTVAQVSHGLVRTVTVARVSHGLVRTVTVARVTHRLVRTVTVARVSHGLVRTVTVARVTHGLVRTVTVARVTHGLVRTVTVARVTHGLVRTVTVARVSQDSYSSTSYSRVSQDGYSSTSYSRVSQDGYYSTSYSRVSQDCYSSTSYSQVSQDGYSSTG